MTNVAKTFQEECPNCGELIDVIDLDKISYIKFCDKCGYESDVDYYQDPTTQSIRKMSKKEALKTGAWFKCPICNGDMTPEENKDYGKCMFCQSDSGGKL